QVDKSGESLSIHISLSPFTQSKIWINNIPPLPKYLCWIQINEDDMEEMDIKWNMALLSMRADKFWKKTGKKINIQGSDIAGFDKSKVECFNCHKMGHFSKEGLGYTAVPPPVSQLYLSPKKDLSWTGLPEYADDTVTDYSRPSPTVESSSEEDQIRNPSASKNVASPITPKQFVKFVKASDMLGRDFKLLDDANILIRTPRQHNMYSIDLNNIVPHRDLTCLVAKASADECNLWHRRLVAALGT
nr:ribonuclease H-like domain-containing protein [Tanacetum cinerariifolium]